MSSDEKSSFQLLLVDARGDSVITTEQQLLHASAAHGQLWQKCELKTSPPRLADTDCEMKAEIITPDDDLDAAFTRAFWVELAGSCSALEPKRIPLLAHYKRQQFELIYVLHDDVSKRIACQLYPLLYRVENGLRGYLLRFMVTRLGPSWWNVTAKADLSGKVTQRKGNEQEFSEHADFKAYLVDFGDLGKMVYSHSSGFSTREDIVRRVNEMEETPEAVKALKDQLQSNYQKFFRETFRAKGFQEKWEQFERLRNKIAHVSLFTVKDLEDGERLASELSAIIEAAESGAPSVRLPIAEKEAIRESFISRGAWAAISELEFLAELGPVETESTARRRYVGLAHFVKFHLGPKGYDFASSYAVAESLAGKGQLEIYDVAGAIDGAPVKAIRLSRQCVTSAHAET